MKKSILANNLENVTSEKCLFLKIPNSEFFCNNSVLFKHPGKELFDFDSVFSNSCILYLFETEEDWVISFLSNASLLVGLSWPLRIIFSDDDLGKLSSTLSLDAFNDVESLLGQRHLFEGTKQPLISFSMSSCSFD